MLNQEAFTKRLHQVFKHYGVSASTFADEIKVQRSSISHLLSGRNKPSLEFVLKVVDTYKEVDLDWLLYGKNTFPKKESNITKTQNLFSNEATKEEFLNEKKTSLEDIKKTTTISGVEKMVVFYKDGTFKEYHPK